MQISDVHLLKTRAYESLELQINSWPLREIMSDQLAVTQMPFYWSVIFICR